MAELAGKNGTYVKISCMVWWDKNGKRVHVTSNDPDIPNNGMHMSAKPGTMTDQNLRALLDNFECGPTTLGVHPMLNQLEKGKAFIEEMSPADLQLLKSAIDLKLLNKNGG